jgi:hypothetical protein
MINVRQAHPSGGYVVSALVRDTHTYEVFLESVTYQGYDKSEARKKFVIYLGENHLVLVND